MSLISAFPNAHGQGMGLRDYFAAHALQAYIIQVKDMSKINIESMSRRAFETADEMMRARVTDPH
jgi:hypothetical protein